MDATREAGEPDHCTTNAVDCEDAGPNLNHFLGQFSVWYQVSLAPGAVRIDTCTTDYDTILAVYTGNAFNNLVKVLDNNNNGAACGSGYGSYVGFYSTGANYRVAVAGDGGAPMGTFTLNVAMGTDMDGDTYQPAPGGTPADCNDLDPNINPGASEVYNVGTDVDENCNGSADCLDPTSPPGMGDDADFDTYDCRADCNEGVASIHPGAPDVPGNGIDEDCNGSDVVLATPPQTPASSPPPAATTAQPSAAKCKKGRKLKRGKCVKAKKRKK